jgi:hypothetical protein
VRVRRKGRPCGKKELTKKPTTDKEGQNGLYDGK